MGCLCSCCYNRLPYTKPSKPSKQIQQNHSSSNINSPTKMSKQLQCEASMPSINKQMKLNFHQRLNNSKTQKMHKRYHINYRFQINQSWHKGLRQNKDRVETDIKNYLKRIIPLKSIIKIIYNNWNRIVQLIQHNYLVINVNVMELIANQRQNCDMDYKIFGIQQLFSKRPNNFKKYTQKTCLKHIQQILQTQYNYLQLTSKQKRSLKEKFQQFFEQQNKHDQANTFNFFASSMVQQFLYIIRYFLAKCKSINRKIQFHSLSNLWTKLVKKIHRHNKFSNIQYVTKHIKEFCIQNARALDEQQLKDYIDNFQENQYSSSKSKSASKGESSASFSKEQENGEPNQKPNDQSSNYVKYYDTHRDEIDFFVINTKKLKYVQPINKEEQKRLILLSQLEQNQMNIIRYIKQEKLEFVAKIQIDIDSHPQDKSFRLQYEKQVHNCFQFVTQKCDSDYSLLSKCFRANLILKQTLWNYKQPKTIYSFLKNFVSCIQILQRHHIHQADFQLQNFIKFGNIFLAIDFNQAFFVRGNIKSNKYFQLNKKIFQSWLHISGSQLVCLTETHDKYKKIQKQYLGNQIQLTSAVNQCINQMQSHMLLNHKAQFFRISTDLLSKQALKVSGFPLDQQQIIAITQILPKTQKDNNFHYQTFLTKLSQIYQKFNYQQIFPQSIKNSFTDIETDLICRQLSLASSFLKGIINIQDKALSNHLFNERIEGIIKLLHNKPLKYVCQYGQIWHSQNDMLLSSLDNNHSLKYQILSSSRNIFLFIKSILQLIQQLQRRGYLLLEVQIDWFVQYGERFMLKNLAFLFKISPQSPQNQKESEMINLSYKTFLRLFDFNLNSKDKNFWKGLQQIVKKQLSQSYSKIHLSDSHLKNQNIAQFLKKKSSYIHFNKFKKMANILFSHNQSGKTKQLKQLIYSKNQENYLSLLNQISELKNQYY